MKTHLRTCCAAALALTASACTRGIQMTPPPLTITDPLAPPAPPQVPPFEGAESLNTEYYLGSAEEEAEMFKRFSEEIREVITRQTARHEQPTQRGFHAKDHGCLHGRLTLIEARDPRTRFGLLAGPRADFPVWARFSNGVGWRQDDSSKDARGVAIKVMEVEGVKLMDDERGTQDFLMTNSPVPIGKDAVHFMRFAQANSKSFLSAVWFALTHPLSGMPGVNRTGSIDDMLAEQYWSGGAYHLGAHQAVKYTTKVCEPVTPLKVDDDHPDYLRELMRQRAREGVCLRLYVQLQSSDPEETPIEYAAVEWDEEVAPLLPVAEVRFPPQEIDQPERAKLCDALSFNPWHSLAAHQPMGHINRARRFVYASSAAFRARGPEPKPYEPPSAAPAPAP